MYQLFHSTSLSSHQQERLGVAPSPASLLALGLNEAELQHWQQHLQRVLLALPLNYPPP